MKTFSDIQSAIKNMNYYNEQIEKLVKTQFNEDFKATENKEINTIAQKIRFDCLAIILSNCQWIRSYLGNSSLHSERARDQEPKIFKPELKDKVKETITTNSNKETPNEIDEMYANMEKEL